MQQKPMRPDILSKAFEEFVERISIDKPTVVEVTNILRISFYTGALTVFSELLPVEKITCLHEELAKWASNPTGEKAN